MMYSEIFWLGVCCLGAAVLLFVSFALLALYAAFRLAVTCDRRLWGMVAHNFGMDDVTSETFVGVPPPMPSAPPPMEDDDYQTEEGAARKSPPVVADFRMQNPNAVGTFSGPLPIPGAFDK